MKIDNKNWTGIHLNSFIGTQFAFARYAASMLREKFHYSGGLHVAMRMNGMRGMRLILFADNEPKARGASELDEDIEFSLDATTDTLATDPGTDSLAMRIIETVLLATNLPVSDKELIRRTAYKHNSWRLATPTS